MKKKFDLYYDDSSSEEDEEREFNNYSNRKLKSGKQQTHENLKKNLGYKYKSDDVNFKKNIDLSFLAHELAINLIKSPIIGKKYFALKKEFLSDNKVPTDEQMKEVVKKAVQSILTMEVAENKINEYVNYLVKDPRKLLKSLKSDDLSYLYPYKNPLGLPIKKQKITENKLLLELQNIYNDKNLKITHQITHKVPKKAIYQAKNYNDLFSYKPTTLMTKFLKFKLLEQNSKMTVQGFINTIIDSNEIQSAIDTIHDKFRSELLGSINQSLQEENKKHTNRATLEKHFSYKTDSIDDYDSAHQLIALGRLMTTSIKRSYKNAQEQQSLLDNTQKSFFRKISLSNVELMETQLLYTNSGSRTDYVEIETQGNSGAYKNIAITIENIKQKLNVTDKQIAQWIRKTFKGETEIYASLDRIKLGQKEELGEFITALTYLLFGTEAVRNPASLIIHQIMLDLIIQNKLTFLSAFTHLENNGVAKYDESNLTVEIISSNKFYKHISGGLMPMSQKRIEQPDIGAVDVARLMHKMFETSMKYTYDKANIDASFAKDMQAYKLFKKIINFEANIIKKWVRTGASEQEILEKLMMKCEEWYGAAPMMQIIIDEIPYNPFYSDIDDLTTKKLIIFKNVFEEDNQAQNKLQRLKNSGANLDLILTIYQDNIEKYNDLSSEEITKIMNKEDLLFSDISDIFDLGMTYELLSELYHEYEEEDKERNKFHDILNVASLEVRKHGYKKINELYDEAISELGGPFDEYGDWSSDILDIVESKLSGDNGQSDSEST